MPKRTTTTTLIPTQRAAFWRHKLCSLCFFVSLRHFRIPQQRVSANPAFFIQRGMNNNKNNMHHTCRQIYGTVVNRKIYIRNSNNTDFSVHIHVNFQRYYSRQYRLGCVHRKRRVNTFKNGRTQIAKGGTQKWNHVLMSTIAKMPLKFIGCVHTKNICVYAKNEAALFHTGDWVPGGCGILSFQWRFWLETHLELWNFVFSINFIELKFSIYQNRKHLYTCW